MSAHAWAYRGGYALYRHDFRISVDPITLGFGDEEMISRIAVRLWILSDIHLELTRGWDLPSGDGRPQFDVLVVAGDLVPRMERGVKWLRERVSDRPIVYVAGNHEAYGADIDRTIEKAKQAAIGTNIFVLQNECIKLDDVIFAGATLWTDFNLFGDQHRAMVIAADRMNDFRKIRSSHYKRPFRPLHALARHNQSRAFFEAEMRKSRLGKLVIVSHHAPYASPTLNLKDPLSPNEILNAAYRSDLTALMYPAPNEGRGALKPADLWLYGHTHESDDIVIGATRVVSNAKGYGPWAPSIASWDNRRFDPNFTLEI